MPSACRTALARLNTNGTQDNCFVRDWGTSYAVALASDVRSDGHIVVAGNIGGAYMGWVQFEQGNVASVASAIADFPGNEEATALDLPSAQPVSIVLYDAAGRAVRTLANEMIPAGRHQRIWDGADGDGRPVAAGVYFAQLVAGTDRDRRKVVVLR